MKGDHADDTGGCNQAGPPHHHGGCCFVAPDPSLLEHIRSRLAAVKELAIGEDSVLSSLIRIRDTSELGLNDGVIRPPSDAPDGASFSAAKASAAQRTLLRGELNVIVVLVDFEDRVFDANPKEHFETLFFDRGDQAQSVHSFYHEASGGLVSIGGKVVGPYRMPNSIEYYADRSSGKNPVVKEMARDALQACDADVDFSPYDNDGDGYVDAYVVVHAGRGAEQTGKRDDIWSHKWTLPGGQPYRTDTTAIFAYLTVPEDARLGVCAHELGHLLFGWPDLYDADYSSSGLGAYCLMAGGSWNGDGDIPCHPSAWCKSTQEWVSVVNHVGTADVTLEDVSESRQIYRLWTKGARASEYFLVENRRTTGFDRALPGTGLLLYHVDESVAGNEDERHPRVALLQADGLDELRGGGKADAGDPFPGSSDIRACSDDTRPNTRGYAGKASGVALSRISADGDAINLRLTA